VSGCVCSDMDLCAFHYALAERLLGAELRKVEERNAALEEELSTLRADLIVDKNHAEWRIARTDKVLAAGTREPRP
jgi:hypothetical protein